MFIIGEILMELTKLNDILTLMIFFSRLKALIKNFICKRHKHSKLPLPNFFLTLPKIFNTKKISNKQLPHCEGNMFLEKVTKSKNSQTNIKSSGNDSLTAKFYKQLSNQLSFNVYQ